MGGTINEAGPCDRAAGPYFPRPFRQVVWNQAWNQPFAACPFDRGAGTAGAAAARRRSTFTRRTRSSGIPSPPHLAPVERVSRVDIGLLKGVEQQKGILLENTLRFAQGLPANNAMLWGARGMGKSSLVKAVHAQVNLQHPGAWC